MSSQKRGFAQFSADVKNSVFSVLYVLLREPSDGQTYSVHFIQLFLDYMQTISFVFSTKIIQVWNADSIFNTFIQFFNYFNIKQYFGNLLGPDAFLALFYAFVLIMLLIIGDIIYVAHSFQRKEFHFIWPLHFLRYFVNIALTVLFLPFISTFSKMVT